MNDFSRKDQGDSATPIQKLQGTHPPPLHNHTMIFVIIPPVCCIGYGISIRVRSLCFYVFRICALSLHLYDILNIVDHTASNLHLLYHLRSALGGQSSGGIDSLMSACLGKGKRCGGDKKESGIITHSPYESSFLFTTWLML